MLPRLAAGAAALVLGAGLSIAALPASAAPAAATHTVTYTPLLPALSSPGAVQVGQTIAFANSSRVDPITVSSTQGAWTLATTPITIAPGATSAPVPVPAAGTYAYTATEKVLGLVPSVLTASGSFTATSSQDPAPAPAASSPAPSGPLSGLTGGQQTTPGNPPAAGAGSGSATASGAGAGTASGSSAGSTGPGGGSGSFDKARFGHGSGDYPSLPGGVIDPVEPQSGALGGAPAPEIAGVPAGTDGGYSAPAPHRSGTPLTNASQDVGTGSSSSSVRGPAAAAAALLALVAVGLSRTWINQRPLGRR